MTWPNSRLRTYAPGIQVVSGDLNAYQDQIIAVTAVSGSDRFLQTFGVGPFVVAPDIGPGTINDYNPWTAAGGSTGDHAIIVLNPSVNGVTITGVVPSGRIGDWVTFMVGGDGHGLVTIGHMSASSAAANRIYCPDNCNLQIPNGGTATFYNLGQTDHGWRLWSQSFGSRVNMGPSLDVTLGATTNNWNPWASAPATTRRIRVTVPATGAVVTGMVANPDALNPFDPGDIVTITNYGDGANSAGATLTLSGYASGGGSSSAGNRWLTPGLASIVLPIYSTVQVMMDKNSFDGTDWLVGGKW